MILNRKSPQDTSGAVCCVLASLVLAGCLDEAVSSSTTVDTYGARDGYVRVIDALAMPCPDLPVLLDGAVLRTDWDGYVKLPDKSGGHELALAVDGSVFVYRGFTLRAPVVHTWHHSSNAFEVHVTASWPTADPWNSGDVAVIAGVTSSEPVRQIVAGLGAIGGMDTTFWWAGPETARLDLEAFRWDRGSGSPLQFTGYARLDRLITSGDQVEWTPSFEPPPFDTSTIKVECPALTEPGQVSAGVIMRRDNGVFGLMPGGEVCNGSALAVPLLQDTWFHVWVETHDAGAEATSLFDRVRAGDVLHAAFRTPPQINAPEQDATGVGPDTPLAWTTQPGAIHRVSVTALDADTYPHSYTIVSAVAEARLPDLTPLGVALPSEKRYAWRPELVFGCASLDDSMAGTCTSTGTASAAHREFTTAP